MTPQRLDVADGEISIKEDDSTMRSLKCGKVVGADGVTAEMVKYGGKCACTCSGFCSIYARNQGRSHTVGEVQLWCL